MQASDQSSHMVLLQRIEKLPFHLSNVLSKRAWPLFISFDQTLQSVHEGSLPTFLSHRLDHGMACCCAHDSKLEKLPSHGVHHFQIFEFRYGFLNFRDEGFVFQHVCIQFSLCLPVTSRLFSLQWDSDDNAHEAMIQEGDRLEVVHIHFIYVLSLCARLGRSPLSHEQQVIARIYSAASTKSYWCRTARNAATLWLPRRAFPCLTRA